MSEEQKQVVPVAPFTDMNKEWSQEKVEELHETMKKLIESQSDCV